MAMIHQRNGIKGKYIILEWGDHSGHQKIFIVLVIATKMFLERHDMSLPVTTISSLKKDMFILVQQGNHWEGPAKKLIPWTFWVIVQWSAVHRIRLWRWEINPFTIILLAFEFALFIQYRSHIDNEIQSHSYMSNSTCSTRLPTWRHLLISNRYFVSFEDTTTFIGIATP